jgi:hypothetical protein
MRVVVGVVVEGVEEEELAVAEKYLNTKGAIPTLRYRSSSHGCRLATYQAAPLKSGMHYQTSRGERKSAEKLLSTDISAAELAKPASSEKPSDHPAILSPSIISILAVVPAAQQLAISPNPAPGT